MTALASDAALFAGAERTRVAVTGQAPPLERWTQHSAQFIFTISRFFQKAGRQNQRSLVRQRVTPLDQGRAFEGNASHLIHAEEKADAMALAPDYGTNRRRQLFFSGARHREFELLMGSADFVRGLAIALSFLFSEMERQQGGARSVPRIGHRGLALRIGEVSMAGPAHFRAGILILIPFSAGARCGEAQNQEPDAVGHVTLRKPRGIPAVSSTSPLQNPLDWSIAASSIRHGSS